MKTHYENEKNYGKRRQWRNTEHEEDKYKIGKLKNTEYYEQM